MISGVFINIPVLNEESNILPLVGRIRETLGDIPFTILFVDDGSADETIGSIEKEIRSGNGEVHLLKREKKNLGCQRGGALLAGLNWGLENTPHDLFVEMDGDLSHRPEELTEGFRHINELGCDVAIASKYVSGGSIIDRSLGRNLISWICSMAVRAVISPRIVDYSNGYRFYNRSSAKIISKHRILYSSPIFLTEVMAIWLHNGAKVAEFPSLYVGRQEGLSKLRWIDLLKAVFAIFEIASRYHVFGFPTLEKPVHPEHGKEQSTIIKQDE